MSPKTSRKTTPAQRRAEEALDQIARSSSQPTKRVLDFLLAGSHDGPIPDQTQTKPRPNSPAPTQQKIYEEPVPDQTQTRQDDIIIQNNGITGIIQPTQKDKNTSTESSRAKPRPDPDQAHPGLAGHDIQDQTQTNAVPSASDVQIGQISNSNRSNLYSRTGKAVTVDEVRNATTVAPTRDFNRRANSIDREALPAGVFPGGSKKLYDALYLRTRGAIQPTRSIQATRKELMQWSGIRNIKTINVHIKKLSDTRLIAHFKSNGDHEGSVYEVFLPEEVSPDQTQTRAQPELSQKTVLDQDQILGWAGSGNVIDNKQLTQASNTILKTDDDETHTLLEFTRIIEEGAKHVYGGELNRSEQEIKRWKELAELLVSELHSAASKTETVSSVPAFLSAQLRRQLAKNQKSNKGDSSNQEEIERTDVKGLRKNKASDQLPGNKKDQPAANKSIFTFNDRRRYAQNQQPPLGNGWMVESSSGKYDELIGEWLKIQKGENQKETTRDVSACPDCQGTGMYYPAGFEKGAAKCRHEKLA